LTRRVISVRTIRVKKLFKVLSDAPELFNRFKQLMVRLPALPEPKLTWDCEPGILDCYRPIIALAEYIGDKEFLDELKTEVTAASNRLREEESFLEGPTFLKALIALANERVKDAPSTQPIGIEIRQLDPAIAAEFGADSPALQLSSNQRNSILREFGFSVRSSGGRYRVFLNIPQLIQVCDECNVEDDLLDAWAIILNLKRVKPQVPGVGETDMGQEGKSEGNSKAE
jgi:hypothetical protein